MLSTRPTRTTAWHDGSPGQVLHSQRATANEHIALDIHALSKLEPTLPPAPSSIRRERRGPWRRSLSDFDVLVEPPATSPLRNRSDSDVLMRNVVGILTELGSKDERESDVDKASKHAVSEFSVEDAGFLLDSSRELFVPRQAFSSCNSETATPSITPMIANRSLTDSEFGKHCKRTPTPPTTPRMACRSLAQDEVPWDTTKHRMVGWVGGQSFRQRKSYR